jgi:8-oxo-dGTP pyrophosphatase MutT (NUDIX family)
MSLDTADDIELSLQESVSSFNRYHGLALPNSDDLTSKTPSGYFTRDGGYMRVSDNPHYDTLVRDGAFAIVFARHQMLLVTPPWTPRTLEIAGGGTKNGESTEDTIRRELAEEIGFEPDLEQSDTFAQSKFYMNLTAEDAHRKFLQYTMKMYAIDITPTLGRTETLEGIVQNYKPQQDGNRRYVVDVDNEYDVDKIIQSHEKLNSFRLGHHLFMRKSVEAYRSLYMDIAPSTTLSTDVPSGLIKQVEAMPYRRKVPSRGLGLK